MKELRNRKGMDYCFPLGIMQDENGELYYIDPIKSLFLIILMPIRIFFPVKLYKITDAKEKQLAYGRYRDEDVQKNIVWMPIVGLTIGSILNRLFSQYNFLILNASLILKTIYISITLIGLFWMIVRRYNVLKHIKLDRNNYFVAKININDIIFTYFIGILICFLIILFVLTFDIKDVINLSYVCIYLLVAPHFTLYLFGMIFKYDNLKFKIIKEVKNKQ